MLKTLSANWNLIIQKADKDNSVVMVEKHVYSRHMETAKLNLISLKKLPSEDEF